MRKCREGLVLVQNFQQIWKPTPIFGSLNSGKVSKSSGFAALVVFFFNRRFTISCKKHILHIILDCFCDVEEQVLQILAGPKVHSSQIFKV